MKAIYLTSLLLVLASCKTSPDLAVLEKNLIEADKSFSEMSVSDGMAAAFLNYCASDAVMLRENSMPVEGFDSITNLMKNTDDSGFSLSWDPLYAKVAASGDLGYTYGLYALRPVAADTVLKGTYVSVWVMEGGQWKWILDSGNKGLGR